MDQLLHGLVTSYADETMASFVTRPLLENMTTRYNKYRVHQTWGHSLGQGIEA